MATKPTKHSRINPEHYDAILEVNGQKIPIQAVHVIDAFFAQDAHIAQAFKYLARAGKKETSSYVEDVAKARWWLEHSINIHGGHEEVPK